MLDADKSVFVDFQKIRIQETQAELPRGCIPRSLEVILRAEAVESVQVRQLFYKLRYLVKKKRYSKELHNRDNNSYYMSEEKRIYITYFSSAVWILYIIKYLDACLSFTTSACGLSRNQTLGIYHHHSTKWLIIVIMKRAIYLQYLPSRLVHAFITGW